MIDVALIIPAAGIGKRFSENIKKQFYEFDSKPIIYWTNQQKIKDPDLIFPKQEFNIVQDSSADEKAKA